MRIYTVYWVRVRACIYGAPKRDQAVLEMNPFTWD